MLSMMQPQVIRRCSKIKRLLELGGISLGLRELVGSRLGWKKLGGFNLRRREHSVSKTEV